MVIFWRDDRPVGHLFVDHANAQGAIGGVDPQVLAAIDAEEQAATTPGHSASVVICTRDRPEELQRCLASLPQQSYSPREVIVVDNASRDQRTKDVALAAGAVYVREERAGLDIARNTGARRATADIVAYTDDDVLLHRRWLERLVAAFDRPDIASVTGLVLPGELATEAQRHFETHWSFGRGYVRNDYTPQRFAAHDHGVFPAWEIGAGASMAFRREVFERVGFFDERLDVGQAGCSGDSEFWYRLLANGLGCRYEPSAVAFHFHRRTMEGLASQIFHYMRGHAAALLVQLERTGIAANRSQAFWRMPRWYGGRLWRRLRDPSSPRDRFLKEEITGFLSGLAFYWRHRRTKQ
jgi:GT2 family glycosyltransferase